MNTIMISLIQGKGQPQKKNENTTEIAENKMDRNTQQARGNTTNIILTVAGNPRKIMKKHKKTHRKYKSDKKCEKNTKNS